MAQFPAAVSLRVLNESHGQLCDIGLQWVPERDCEQRRRCELMKNAVKGLGIKVDVGTLSRRFVWSNMN